MSEDIITVLAKQSVELIRQDANIAEQADRIEQLEAALREIDMACSNPGSWSPVVMERVIERVQELSRAAVGEK